MPDRGALDDGDNERRSKYEARWHARRPDLHEAPTTTWRSTKKPMTPPPISSATRSPRREGPRDRKAAATQRSSARLEADLRRHRLFATYNRPNVTLVESGRTRSRRSAHGVRAGGTDHEVEALVFATGFDAITGSSRDRCPRPQRADDEPGMGEGPRPLSVSWRGLPNLFLVTGPGSPSVLGNMVVFDRAACRLITACIAYMRDRGSGPWSRTRRRGELVARVNEIAHGTLYPKADSWYMGANVPGKPRIFMPYSAALGPIARSATTSPPRAMRALRWRARSSAEARP